MKRLFKIYNRYYFTGVVGLGLLTIGTLGLPFPLVPAQSQALAEDEDIGPFADPGPDAGETVDLSAVTPQNIGPGFAEGEKPAEAPVAKIPLSPARQREENLRRLMRSLGCDIPEVQTAVINYIVQDTGARQPLRDSTSRLFLAMRTPGLPDAEIGVILKDTRIALDGDKTRRANAETAMRAAIGYNITPRLEAMLLLLGLQGDMAFSTPNPKLIAMLEQERNKLRRDGKGLKIEVESLRRERDAARAERDDCRQAQLPTAAPVPTAPAATPTAMPNSYDAPASSKVLQERDALKRDKERLQKEVETLKRELEAAKQGNKR